MGVHGGFTVAVIADHCIKISRARYSQSRDVVRPARGQPKAKTAIYFSGSTPRAEALLHQRSGAPPPAPPTFSQGVFTNVNFEDLPYPTSVRKS